MDLIAEMVGDMRLSGGVILDAEFRAPWRVISYLGPDDCAPFFDPPAHIIAYHYVRSGSMWASVDDLPPAEIGPGEIVMFPRNDRHHLYSSAEAEAVDAHTLIRPSDGGALARISWGREEGERCTIFCGYLGCDRPDHLLLASLPPMLKVEVAEEVWASWLESSLRLAATGGAAGMLGAARISELVFAEAVRRYLDELPEGERGWLPGLRDPVVQRALTLIHKQTSDPLDMETLAREVGLSRSALSARFTSLVGEPPIRYWTKRRLHAAAELLAEGRVSASEAGFRVGFGSEPAFSRAFKREYGVAPSAWRRKQEQAAARPAGAGPAWAQAIEYCSASDGTRLAYGCAGEGAPLVKTANWLNHLEHEWESPIWRHWLRELTRSHRLLRYDERGNGLSDRAPADLSFEAFVSDLETVVDAAGFDRFDLIGISQGAAVAIAYAVRHPQRVNRLVLYGGYPAGWAVRGEPEEVARREAMITLTRMGWGQEDPAFRQLFTNLYFPGATAEESRSFNELQRVSASPEEAQRLQRALSRIDVRELVPLVRVPTLIFHARGDRVVPAACGEELADRIPGARLVLLDSDNHLVLEHEAAWPQVVEQLHAFLRPPDPPAPGATAIHITD
jgi:pimeloyl-ACP methyl ester carboxylesterase/AraC-like DNA-binding protein